MSNTFTLHFFNARRLPAYCVPGELGLIGPAHIVAQDIEIAVAGDGGGLVLGTARFNQPHRRVTRKPCGT